MGKTDTDILNENASFKSSITNGNYSCVGVPYVDAKKAMREFADQELADYKARLKEAISEDYKVTMLRSQGLRTVINVDSVYQLIDKL